MWGQNFGCKAVKKDIIEYAHTIGIDSIGFTTADPFDELKQKLEDYHSKGYASGFEESDIALRTEPKLLTDSEIYYCDSSWISQ